MTHKRPIGQAIRAAIVVTVVTLATATVWDLGANGFFATFACVLLLMIADFGGPPKSRFLANIFAGLGGMVAITLGALVNSNLVLTLVVTALLSFALAYSVVLRGYIGTAFTTLLMPYVVSTTTDLQLSDLPVALLAFGGGTLISAIAAVTMWPTYQTSQLRTAVGESLLKAAKLLGHSKPLAAEATMAQAASRMRELVSVNNELEKAYIGQLARPGIATSRDRGLVGLVDDLSRLRFSLFWTQSEASTTTAADLELLRVTQETLEACGKAMLRQGPIPEPDAIISARMKHNRNLPKLADELLAEHQSQQLKHEVETSFYYRITAFVTAMITRHTRMAMGHPVKKTNKDKLKSIVHHDPDTVAHIDAATKPGAILRSHLTLKSPWLRRALQTSVGVTLAIAVVQIFQLDHGFWVVLGIVAALKLNATNTGKTALWALLGTAVGFAIIATLLVITNGNNTPLIIILPFVIFLAVWIPAGKFQLPLRQAGFTVLFIMLGSLASGLSLYLGTLRLADVAIGLSICLFVATLMWPRGVAREVRMVITNSVRSTADYFAESFAYVTSPMGPEDTARLRAATKRATTARIRANDEFDVAISQGGQIGVNARSWTSVANSVDHLFVAGILVWSIQKFGLAPIPDPKVATRLREDSRTIADQFSAAIESNLQVLRNASKPGFDQSTVNRQVLQPHRNPKDDLDELTTEVDQALARLDGKSGDLSFKVDGVPFTMSYGQAAISLLWSQDWLMYFDWVAAQTEQEAARNIIDLES